LKKSVDKQMRGARRTDKYKGGEGMLVWAGQLGKKKRQRGRVRAVTEKTADEPNIRKQDEGKGQMKQKKIKPGVSKKSRKSVLGKAGEGGKKTNQDRVKNVGEKRKRGRTPQSGSNARETGTVLRRSKSKGREKKGKS